MSRTKRFIGGVSFGYFNQALITVLGLWLTPFLLHRVGQHDYGLWLVSTQLLAYLTLMDFGVVALLPRSIAYATGRAGGIRESFELPEIIGQTARVVFWQMPLVALAAFILWLTIPAKWQALRLPLGLVMLTFVLIFPLRIFQATLQGLQDLSFLGKTVICAGLASTALTVVLVLMGFGLYALAIGWVFTQASMSLVFWLRLRSRFPKVLPHSLPPLPWTIARGQLGKSFWVSVAQVAQVLVAGTDIIIIGKFLGPLAVVPFACTDKLISVMANQPQMLMQSAGPALSEMKMAESRERLFQVCTALSQAMLLVSGAVVCVVLSVNQGFVNWWVGSDQYGGLILSALLLLEMLLRHWNTTAVYAIFCFGYERRISVTTLIDGVVTVGGAIAFVHFLGPIGAPLGTILGVCSVSLPGNLSALARENGVTLAAMIKPLWPWFWRFSILVSGAWYFARTFTPRPFPLIALSASLVALVYLAIMLPVIFRDPLGAYIRPRMVAIKIKLFGRPLIKDADV